MSVDLTGKVGIVTGSTSGIGLGMAKALAGAGATVVVNGLGSPEEIENAVNEVRGQSGAGEVVFKSADMTKPDQIRSMIKEIEDEFGRLDILVNNAGIQHTESVEDFPAEKWDQIIAINLSSVFHSMAQALPGMKERGYGRIVNVASVHGLVASKNKAAYVAAKHGVVGLTKVTALENAESNVTCNAICPGWVLTPLVQKQIDANAERDGVSNEEATKNLLKEKEPSLRFTQPEELAGGLLFLLSDAGNNMTGSSLTMDGGWSAQ